MPRRALLRRQPLRAGGCFADYGRYDGEELVDVPVHLGKGEDRVVADVAEAERDPAGLPTVSPGSSSKRSDAAQRLIESVEETTRRKKKGDAVRVCRQVEQSGQDVVKDETKRRATP